MAAISTPDLFKAYLAYFGRPPDLTGLSFFSNKTEAEVVAAFSASPESVLLLNSLGDVPSFVNSVYLNLFNRPAEFTGAGSASHWVDQITLGHMTQAEAAMAILRSALGTDAQTVTAKYNASVQFVDALDTSAEVLGYSGEEAAQDGRDFLATVDYQHIPSQSDINAAVLVATTPNPVIEPTPTMDIAVSATAVNEGDTVVFTINTTHVAAGSTYAYTLSGVQAADIVGGSLSGTVTIDANGKGYVNVGLANDLTTEGSETMTMTVGTASSVGVTIEDTSVTPPPVDTTYILTAGADVIHANAANDTFVATQATLQLGDSLFGGDGNDTLDLSISGNGSYVNGFSTESVETIRVKSLSTSDSTLDVSDVQGPVTLMSNETDGASLTFHDIQSINDTNIVVVDTDESHIFQYDVGNSATNNDVAEISVQEMRLGSGIYLENNGSYNESFVDQIILNSAVRADPGVQPSNTYKNDMDLVAGEDLDTLTITGDADLWITNVLDRNISLVDAHAHTGAKGVNEEAQQIIGNWWELELDMSNSNDGNLFTVDGVDVVTVRGSQGDNRIDFGSNDPHGEDPTTHNYKIVDFNGGAGVQDIASSNYTGNDWLRTGSGAASVNSGAGNDTVLTSLLNDVVIAGEGDDVLIDGGSTTLYWNHGSTVNGYDGRFEEFGNRFDLGGGNDMLMVETNSNNTVDAGAGNDTVIVHGSVVDGWANDQTFGNIVSKYDLGAGNDLIQIGESGSGGVWGGSRGSNSVVGGDGNDSIYIFRDGDQTVIAGAGNDVVQIIQDNNQFSGDHFDGTTLDGNHYVDLGEGNDNLLITGRSNLSKATIVIAGAGNDTVRIDQDHELNADLGTGNDFLRLRAEDLQSDDTIDGGDGYDTIILSNSTYNVQTGSVQASETRKVSHIEQFNLLDVGIRLDITDNLVGTADNKTVTVDTSGSSYSPGDLPIVLPQQLFQGMNWSDYATWDVSYNLDSRLDAERTPNPDPAKAGNSSYDLAYFVYDDSVFVPSQTVDLTALNTVDYTFILKGGSMRDVVIVDEDALSTDLYLNFDGGSGTSGADPREGWTTTDTLQVVDAATIRAQDLEHVFDMEIIDLVSTKNNAQAWTVELDNHIINQPTGLSDLIIRIDPTVAAGSSVYVVFSEDDVNLATNNVIVERNANVNVYVVVRDSMGNEVEHLVTEDQYNRTDIPAFDFPGTSFQVIVKSQLNFTTNSDNLFGTETDDTFVATSINQVQSSDDVDGNPDYTDPDNVNVGPSADEDFDTMEFRFAVSNQNNDLDDQLNNLNFYDIEHIWFNTNNQVQMDGLYFGEDAEEDLTHLTTGSASDRLLNIEVSGLWFTLNEGNDYISFDSYGYYENYYDSIGTYYGEDFDATVSGGAGKDSVIGDNGNDHLTLGLVEVVNSGDGNDRILFSLDVDRWGNSLGGNDGNVSVWAGTELDSLRLDDNGTNGTVTVWDAESIFGGDSTDTIVAYINNDSGMSSGSGGNTATMSIWGDGFDGDASGAADHITAFGTAGTTVSVWGEQGNDTINVDTYTVAAGYGASDLVLVSGGDGNDLITIGYASPTTVFAQGDAGNDTIMVHAKTSAYVTGDAGNDVIGVTVGSGMADADASVLGGTGNDTITVVVTDDAYVDGGNGNDLISVTSSNSIANTIGTAGTTIEGGDGNDTISTHGSAAMTIHGGGDSGADLIVLDDHAAALDWVKFGNLTHNAAQGVAIDTQGLDRITGFQFESYLPGDPAPVTQDVMDFTEFLGSEGIGNRLTVAGTWVRGTTEVANGDAGNSIVVLSAAAGSNYVLDGNDFSVNLANTIQLNDNSRNVVVVGQDQTGSGSGIGEFDVYYVEDVDTGSLGQTWVVTKVADVAAYTRVGVGSVMDNLVVTQDMVVSPTNTSINTGSDLDSLTVTWFDHSTPGVQVYNFDSLGVNGSEDAIDFWNVPSTFVNAGNVFGTGGLGSDTVVSEHSVVLMWGDSTPDAGDEYNVNGTGTGGEKLMMANDGDAILIAADSAASTTANVYHMYDSQVGAGINTTLVLIGTIVMSEGNVSNLDAANFI